MKWVNIFATKQTFLLFVFCNLIIQLVITRYTIEKAPKKQNKWYTIGLFIVSLLLIMLMSFTMPMIMKFILFCLFSVIMGFIIAGRDLSDAIIDTSFYGALGIFVLMGSIGSILSVFGINLSPTFGIGLFIGLLLLILISIFNLITGDLSHKLISSMAILLFSVYIVYDTNVILQRNYKGDFISASISYYLDIINLFSGLATINE